ncbi:MAG: carboxypeptidase regulatory-like domain-containing protein [Planctomycetes bacterium]|nr:carboxypeptidase regulatory-like domain-containing protein [Planctomycetota bacterium]
MKRAAQLAVGIGLVLVISILAWRALLPVQPKARVESRMAEREVETREPDAPARLPVTPTGEQPPSTAASIETPKSRATGVVVDRAGQPIVDARVGAFANAIDEPTAVDLARSPDAVRTDRAGRFEIALNEGATEFDLFAEARGFAPASRSGVRAGDDVVIELDHEFAFVGKVTDKDGAPIAGAAIAWVGWLASGRLTRTATSGADGSYRLDGLPAVRQPTPDDGGFSSMFDVHAEGFSPLVLMAVDSLHPARPRGEDRRDFVLVRGETVRGRVLDADSGEPIAGARVVAWMFAGATWMRRSGEYADDPESARVLGETNAAGDGTFQLSNQPALGFYLFDKDSFDDTYCVETIAAIADGYAPGATAARMALDGSTLDVEIRCSPAATVTGRVVDEEGAPIPGARLAVEPDEWGIGALPKALHVAEWLSALTDGDGRYSARVTGSRRADGVPLIVRVSSTAEPSPSPDAESHVAVTVRAGETVAAPDIVVSRRRPSVQVTVTDENERPIRGATVSAGGFSPRAGLTDESGRVHIGLDKGIERIGRVRLAVASPGRASTVTPDIPLTGDVPADVRVVLGPEHRISGTVVFADGSPVSGALVRAVDADVAAGSGGVAAARARASARSALAAEDGSFEFRDLAIGSYDVAACAHRTWIDGGTGHAYVRSNTNDVVLTIAEPSLSQRGTIGGRVTDAITGEPLLRFSAEFRNGADSIYADRLAPGRFRIVGLVPGSWTLTVKSPGYPTRVQDLTVTGTEREDPPIAIELDRFSTVRGVVRAANGASLDDALILFVKPGAGNVAAVAPRARLERDGSYSLSGLEAGDYQPVVKVGTFITQSVDYLPSPPASLTVPSAGGDLNFDVTIDPAIDVGVVVRSPRLPPVRGVATDEQRRVGESTRVEFVDERGRIAWAMTDVRDNRIYQARVPHGRYTVRALVPGTDVVEKSVRIDAPGMSVRLDVP